LQDGLPRARQKKEYLRSMDQFSSWLMLILGSRRCGMSSFFTSDFHVLCLSHVDADNLHASMPAYIMLIKRLSGFVNDMTLTKRQSVLSGLLEDVRIII
jgi:hypothetical protein